MADKQFKPETLETVDEQAYTINGHYVFSVPPGWIYVGTVTKVLGGKYLVLRDAAYAENNESCWALCAASPKEQPKICTAAHPLPDGFLLRVDCITAAGPAVSHFRALARKGAADAIKEIA